nr:DNA topoisomerase 2-like [Tanacetum cinerariifolium]
PDNLIDSKEKYISINRFINKEFILYSKADNHISTASSIDGLKPSQRKILYCARKILSDKEDTR